VVVIVSGAAEEQEACTVVELDPRECIPGYCQFECSQQYQDATTYLHEKRNNLSILHI
jgi:hypothetical protein